MRRYMRRKVGMVDGTDGDHWMGGNGEIDEFLEGGMGE